MAPREINLHMRAARAAREASIHERRVLQQEMAHLTAFAHHQPDKMPDFAKSKAPALKDPETAEKYRANQALAAALNFQVAMAAKAKQG